MAYMGRGGFSSFAKGIGGEHIGHARRMFHFRRGYYIPLDNTYVAFQIIATLIILVVGVIAYLTTYKSPIIDPIEGTKKVIINVHIIIVLSILILTIISNYFSKDKNALKKRLLTLLLLAAIAMTTFLGIKINLNKTYTSNKFGQIYEQEYGNAKNHSEQRIDVDFSGIKIKTEKEFYVDECMKMYNIFNIKTYGIIILNTLLVLLLIYQIMKVSNIQEKKEQLNKDDAILFDEEENIKI